MRFLVEDRRERLSIRLLEQFWSEKHHITSMLKFEKGFFLNGFQYSTSLKSLSLESS